MQKHKEASEVFADYTLSRIPIEIRATFSHEQVMAIRNALIMQAPTRGNVLDLRFIVPLFFRKYYVLIKIGRDRRKITYHQERLRIAGIPKPIRTLFMATALLMIFLVFGIFLFVSLYMFKSLLGIDIFPNFHLLDLFS